MSERYDYSDAICKTEGLPMILLTALTIALVLLSGCTAAQVTAAEADVHAAFVDADALVVAGSANPAALTAAVQRVVALDPTNATLVSFGNKATAAIAAGDITTLHVYTSGGAALTAPPSAALVPAKAAGQ